jgi:hypothetical protein
MEDNMASSFKVIYAYKKPTTSSWTSTSFTAKAESEQMAVRIVEDRHPGFDIQIRSVTQLP